MEIERRRQSDRELEKLFTLMKQTRDQITEMNGTVRRHNEEIFGLPEAGKCGLVREVDDIHDFVVTTKSSVKTIVTIVSIIGVANIIALVMLMANLGGAT
jgi:hypothetical protein